LSNKFKNAQGRRLLAAMFFETTLADKSQVLFSLKEHDHEGFPSLYRLYMEASDPTEYQFAISNLDGWAHWQELSACKWFEPYLTAWRSELEVKLSSQAQARLREIAADESNPNYYYANKHLLELARKPAEAGKRGRPSKGSRDAEETHQRAILGQINDDAKRLGIN
jgi:hypothetical protein